MQAAAIVPVIDLQAGVVVRGIAGDRASYRPIVSRIAKSSAPRDVAAAFVERGYRAAYVADLDAIAGGAPALAAYEQLAATGLSLWIDAGTGELARAEEIAGLPYCDSVVIGLETLRDRGALVDLMCGVSSRRVIFSLDLKRGKPITRIERWKNWTPLAIAKAVAEPVEQIRLARMLVLDLVAVGVARGPATLDIIREIRGALPHLELIGGGGARNRDDLALYAQAGCSAVLVASALHDERM
jgi:phosphoribosylformimino-5-aminoimidazole carboxamide ribotide isomerase